MKILTKFTIQYISVKEKDVALQLSNFLFLDHTVPNVINYIKFLNILSSLFRFKRNNEGLEVKNMSTAMS